MHVFIRLVSAFTITALLLGILVSCLVQHGRWALRELDRAGRDSTKALPETTVNAMASASLWRTPPLVLPAIGKHTATVFFAHGLGDTGAGWADVAQRWRRKPQLNGVKFVLPNAPVMPITVNFMEPMPAWFDIKILSPSLTELETVALQEDSPGILRTRDYFHELIQDEIRAGISANRIVLGGFSQGGAMSILAGLTAPVKIAGIIGISSWLLFSQSIKEHIPFENLNKATPILMAHGDSDQVVAYELAEASHHALKGLAYNVTLKSYRGLGHGALEEELDDIEAFLSAVLPSQTA